MCSSPVEVLVNNIRGQKRLLVPCGKCPSCLQKKQNDWMIRLSEESKCHKDVFFVTFTYNTRSIPTTIHKSTGEVHYSVCKKHIQNLLKRFRIRYLRTYGDAIHLKYFLCSEYGPKTLRPHYHALFFGLNNHEINLLCSEWQRMYGFTYLKRVGNENKDKYSVSRYVAKYCSKGQFENPFVSQKLVKPTFRLISKGIGLNYVYRMKPYHLFKELPSLDKYFRDESGKLHFTDMYLDKVVDRYNIVLQVNNKTLKFSLPRYYKEKIYGTQNNLSDAIAEKILERVDQLRHERSLEILSHYPYWTYDKAYGLTFVQDAFKNFMNSTKSSFNLYKFLTKSKL